MGKSTISMAIFNSYFDITRGYQGVHVESGARWRGAGNLWELPLPLHWRERPFLGHFSVIFQGPWGPATPWYNGAGKKEREHDVTVICNCHDGFNEVKWETPGCKVKRGFIIISTWNDWSWNCRAGNVSSWKMLHPSFLGPIFLSSGFQAGAKVGSVSHIWVLCSIASSPALWRLLVMLGCDGFGIVRSSSFAWIKIHENSFPSPTNAWSRTKSHDKLDGSWNHFSASFWGLPWVTISIWLLVNTY